MHIQRKSIAVVVHGGVGNRKDNEDGCVAAAQKGFEQLRGGSDALAAAVEAVVILEDDERFNAGTGSITRADGATIETDAAVMDSRGRLGAVCCLQRVKNPVLVARKVVETRHWMLAGAGALAFARAHGFGDHDLSTLRQGSVAPPEGCDTVGAVALDKDGHFAVASSTGGFRPALPGRVGDTPIPGCGFWVGPQGAVAATGLGEEIVARMLARVVYDAIEHGIPLRQALDLGIALFPRACAVGLIAVTRAEAAAASNQSMPFHIIDQELAS